MAKMSTLIATGITQLLEYVTLFPHFKIPQVNRKGC